MTTRDFRIFFAVMLLFLGNFAAVFALGPDLQAYPAGEEYLVPVRGQAGDQVIAGACLLAGLCYLIFFALRPKDRWHGFCGIFSLLAGLYGLSGTGGSLPFFPGAGPGFAPGFFCLFLAPAALGGYTGTICRGRVSPVSRIFCGVFVILALVRLFFPRPLGFDILALWQALALVFCIWILFHDIVPAFSQDARAEGRPRADRGTKTPGILRRLRDTCPGNLLVALVVVLLCAAGDLAGSLLFPPAPGFIRYGFGLFAVTPLLIHSRGRIAFAGRGGESADSAYMERRSPEDRRSRRDRRIPGDRRKTPDRRKVQDRRQDWRVVDFPFNLGAEAGWKPAPAEGRTGLGEKLAGLRRALAGGDAGKAAGLLREFSFLSLNQEDREACLYVSGLLEQGKMEKASAAVELWGKLRRD